MILRALILLGLTAGILGGAAYFSYELFWKPVQLDQEDKKEFAARTPTPPPDPSRPAYEKAMEPWRAGRLEEALPLLANFVADFPESPQAAEVKRVLGDHHSERLFSPAFTEGKMSHAVSAGDSLVRIATKLKTNAELIYRTNNLESINLKIGQQLWVPKVDLRISVRREAKTVTLYNQGVFFKEYPAMAIKIPGAAKPLETKVSDKIALKGSNRVAFGDKHYPEADRWIMLQAPGLAIRSVPEGAPTPPGVVVSPEALGEIYLLVSRGTPVTIH
jgi:hypothetical protein